MYPIYLSWPLALLKYFRMDYQYLVIISPYIAHFPLLVLSDYFLWHVGKATVGKSATRVAFILILTNIFTVEYDIRCFTNTLEKICTVIAMHFYLKQKNEHTRNTAIFTALLTISFMMRNTSPVGWIPLLFIKVIYEGSFTPFLYSLFDMALPLILGCVLLDSLYYMGENQNQFEFVITSINFLKVNVL